MANRSSPDAPSDLREALRKHLNYYFSDENLAKDSYLLSRMDEDLVVDVDIIASFRAIQSKTTDLNLVVEVLETCDNVLLIEGGKRARPKNWVFYVQPRGTLIFSNMDPKALKKNTKRLKQLFGDTAAFGNVEIFSDLTAGPGTRWYAQVGAGEAAAVEAMKLAASQGIATSMKSVGTLKQGLVVPPQYSAPPPASPSYPVAPGFVAPPFGYYDPQQVQAQAADGYFSGHPMVPFGMYGYPGQYPQGAYAVAPGNPVMPVQPGMYRPPLPGYVPAATPTAVSSNHTRSDGSGVGGVGGGRGGSGNSNNNRGGNAAPLGSKKSPRGGGGGIGADDGTNAGKGGKKGHSRTISEGNGGQSSGGNTSHSSNPKKSKGQQNNNAPFSTSASSTKQPQQQQPPQQQQKVQMLSVGSSSGGGKDQIAGRTNASKKKKGVNKKKGASEAAAASTAKAPELALNNFPALPGGLGKAAPPPKPAPVEWKMADVVRGKSSPKRNSGAEFKGSSGPTAPTPFSGRVGGAAAASASTAVATAGPAALVTTPSNPKSSGSGGGSDGEQQQPLREKKKKPKGKEGGGGGDSNHVKSVKVEKVTPPVAPPELGGPIVGRSADDTDNAPAKLKAPKVAGVWGKTNTMAAVVAGRAAPTKATASNSAAVAAAAVGASAPRVSPTSASLPPSTAETSLPSANTATALSSSIPPTTASASEKASAPEPAAATFAPVKSAPATVGSGGGGAWGASNSSTTSKPSFAEMLRRKNEEAAAQSGN